MRFLDRLRRTIPVHACTHDDITTGMSGVFDDLPIITPALQLPAHDGDMAQLHELAYRICGDLDNDDPAQVDPLEVWSEIGDDLAIELDIDEDWPIDNPIWPLLDAWRDQLDANEAIL